MPTIAQLYGTRIRFEITDPPAAILAKDPTPEEIAAAFLDAGYSDQDAIPKGYASAIAMAKVCDRLAQRVIRGAEGIDGWPEQCHELDDDTGLRRLVDKAVEVIPREVRVKIGQELLSRSAPTEEQGKR